MAYNPQLYNPYGQSQPNWWSQPVWQAPTHQVSNQPVNGLVSVTGIEGAKAYQLPPNSSMPLFDSNNDVLYVKTTDSAGYPTIKTFKFEPAEQNEPMEVDPTAGYVPRAEFEALVTKVEELSRPKVTRGRKAENDE